MTNNDKLNRKNLYLRDIYVKVQVKLITSAMKLESVVSDIMSD